MFPVLFQIGGFAVPSFGVLVLAGCFAGILLQKREAARLGYDARKVEELALVTILLGWAGGRGAFLIQNWDAIRAAGKSPLGTEGFVLYGGFLLAIPAAYFLGQRAGIPGARLVDIFSPGVVLGIAIGRIGCLGAGCDYGAVAPEPAWYTLTFTDPASKVPPALLGVPLLPSQPLMALGSFATFAVIYPARKALTPWPGALLFLTLWVEPPLRFLIEFTRGDPDRGFLGPLSTSQALALAAAPLFLALFLWRIRCPRVAPPAGAR